MLGVGVGVESVFQNRTNQTNNAAVPAAGGRTTGPGSTYGGGGARWVGALDRTGWRVLAPVAEKRFGVGVVV